jgi:hypothetical protein
MSEGPNNQDPNGNDPVNLEELTAKMAKMEADLEAERSSKARILEESKKYKDGYQTYKSKQDEVDAANKKAEEERLMKEGQFSTIIEQREARIAELEQNLDSTLNEVKTRDTAITNFKKAGAFEKALGGKIKHDSYWSHVDFDKIVVNPETGQIDGQSLRNSADSFLETHKELVDFGSNPNLPNHTPGSGGSGKLTYAQWQKLPLGDRKKRMKDVID